MYYDFFTKIYCTLKWLNQGSRLISYIYLSYSFFLIMMPLFHTQIPRPEGRGNENTSQIRI
jgi:hypothetical protein